MKKGFLHESPRPKLSSVIKQEIRGNQKFQPLPQPTRGAPYHLSLDDVLSVDEIQSIKDDGSITFHCMGDTGGVKDPVPEQLVANGLENTKASFLYHLGDVVYYNGESQQYYSQFYEPFQHYQNPIFAIPGNHDGDPLPGGIEESLFAFNRNFCAIDATKPSPDSGEVNKSPMIQPNVYWTLIAPYVTLIGLYTNVPEGGEVHPDQVTWFENELGSADKSKALIVALHHPLFSMDKFHSGSQAMLDLLDNAFDKTGVLPDAVLTGHVHNYQRFTRTHFNGKKVPYIVAGAGGYWHLHWMQQGVIELSLPEKVPDRDDVVLEKYCDDHHGFMRVQVTPERLYGEYYITPRPHESWHASESPTQFDSFEIELQRKEDC
ncbi:MAG TPA: metallophosphoesterase [Candidatus Nitrosopolaris sp.]|nr:metallophosphoesterase [Candidatus Nitrosopolaris sp.]